MLVNEMCPFRKLDIFNSVGIDGGGSLKIIMNVFDPTALNFPPRNQKYIEVNKVIIVDIGLDYM